MEEIAVEILNVKGKKSLYTWIRKICCWEKVISESRSAVMIKSTWRKRDKSKSAQKFGHWIMHHSGKVHWQITSEMKSTFVTFVMCIPHCAIILFDHT